MKSHLENLPGGKPSQSRVYEAKCILCQKVNKYLKGTKTREELVKCTTLEADEQLRNAAMRKMDKDLLSILSRDIVAAEGHYHRTCYCVYTKEEHSSVHNKSTISDAEIEYSMIEEKAYTVLFEFIRDKLFSNPDVLTMTDLTTRLMTCMTSQGCQEIKVSTKKHIRRKLEAEFGESLHIIHDSKGKLVVYPDNLLRDKLVLDNLMLKSELKAAKSSEKDRLSVLTKAALQMRDDIREQHVNDEWPPQPSELTPGSAHIPASVTYFLHTIITGQQVESNRSIRVERQINSFGQDIVYAVTCGKQRPPKHVLLPLVIKSLTGNVELIQILNCLGHCVSYSMIEQIETALCLQKLGSDQNVTLPSNIYPHVFTTLVWDNIDRLEETLSGGGTSHRVNGIAIQPEFIGPRLEVPKPKVMKSKKRSISTEELPLPEYNAGERVGPPTITTMDPDTAAAMDTAKTKNQVWVVCPLSVTYTTRIFLAGLASTFRLETVSPLAQIL